MHGVNEGKHNNRCQHPGTKASTANPLNANQPVVEIASIKDDTSSDKESEGNDTLLSSNDSSASPSSVEDEQSAPAGGG